MPVAVPYIPGRAPEKAGPLARYLPPLPVGVAANWLRPQRSIGSSDTRTHWILDPFGASPQLVAEIARAGYRVLVAANNPISRFLIEMEAAPPLELEFRAALAEIAASRKGDKRLEVHLRSLYETECPQCGNSVEAEAFIWDRGSDEHTAPGTKERIAENRLDILRTSGAVPVGKILQCESCGEKGEHPASNADRERAAKYSSSGLHYSRAMERVTSPGDPDRHHVEEALSTYLPRAIYALFVLINKLDGLSLTPRQRKILTALLLSACDRANTLWPYPTGRARPRLLTIPPRFRENNLWMALENAIQTWTSSESAVPTSFWPDVYPGDAGVCIYEGRLKDLVENLEGKRIGAVVTAAPRPNQAFWTLSALWAGWLWGREALGPFKAVLRRRRYDWSWHTTALQANFSHLYNYLQPGTQVIELIGEAESSFLSSAMIASESSGFQLTGIALRAESGQAQISWSRSPKIEREDFTPEDQIDCIQKSAAKFLRLRGEASSYLHIHAAALCGLAEKNWLSQSHLPPAENLSQLNKALEESFTYRAGFLRYSGSEKSLEVGQWWLREDNGASPPLSDRIEMHVVRRLLKKPLASGLEIDQAICQLFPGISSPSIELVHICLESYGEQIPPSSGVWQIRDQDQPRRRRAEMKTIVSLLEQIAARLGYRLEGHRPLLWLNEEGEIEYVCHVIASAVIGSILLNPLHPPSKSLIILPGSRANLVAYKLQKDLRLRQNAEKGSQFIKFRTVRWLADNPVLNRESLIEQLALDALTYDAPQLRLF